MEQKIVFITKSLCYHQVGLADQLFDSFGERFSFIQMREPLDFRVQAKQEGFVRPYLHTYIENETINRTAVQLLNDADLIIWGEASLKVMKGIKQSAIILKYSERVFKKGYYKNYFIRWFLNYFNLFRLKFFLRKREKYLLSAGYFSSRDYQRVGLFKNTSMKWGYFPPLGCLDDSSKSFDENVLKIMWVGRLIKWKHPEMAIFAANILKENGVNFEMAIVGDGDAKSGEMKKKIEKAIINNDLSNNVKMLGKVEPKVVLELYNKSHLSLFTSGPAEGWGVGVNEAMNYKNIVIASDKIGSALYLIENNKNGFLYKFGSKKDFKKVLLNVLKNKKNFAEIADAGHKLVSDKWCCKEAAARLIVVINALLNHQSFDIYHDEGPCSLIR